MLEITIRLSDDQQWNLSAIDHLTGGTITGIRSHGFSFTNEMH